MAVFDFVVPNDPVGTAGRYRRCGLALRCPDGLREICWCMRGVDGSVYFGLKKDDLIAHEIGAQRMVDGGPPTIVTSESLVDEPEEVRRNPKASLHPRGQYESAICQMHAHGQRSILRYPFFDWHPVTRRFNWIHAFTGPLTAWPIVPTAHARDAVIPFADHTKAARIALDIIPRPTDGFQIVQHALDSVFGFGPDYGVEISVHVQDTNRPGILIRDDNILGARHEAAES